MSSSDEPFLKRWSRRKIEAKDPPEKADTEPGEDAAPSSEARGDSTDSPQAADRESSAAPGKDLLTEADFADVDFDALDFKSDYSRFLGPGVPETIKTKALGKLWASDPIFTQIDPFQDYAGDFTDKAVALPAGMLKTAYKVGRGFMTDEEVAEWERLGKPDEKKIAAAHATKESTPAVAADADTPATAVLVHAESPDPPDVRELLRQSEAYFAALYPGPSHRLGGIPPPNQANACLLVARRDGAVMGCGTLLASGDGSGEIRRIFVVEQARRQKVGVRLLEALEQEARALGLRRILLETRNRQHAALQLFRSHGYYDREPFGGYSNDPASVFLEKWLD
jgi:putative acetyltransferase